MGKTTEIRDVNYRLLFGALVLACMSLFATWENNHEIAQRRVHDPVETVAALHSVNCSHWRHHYYAYLVYNYAAQDGSLTRYDHASQKWFETEADCREFIETMKNNAPIWYERSHPELASFYPDEPDSWGFLTLLIPSAILFWCAMTACPPINKSGKRRKSRA